MYSVEIDEGDRQFLIACALGVVRRAQMSMPTKEAIAVTTQAAECISRLNEARLTTLHVKFFNTCIQKTIDLLQTDPVLPRSQKEAIRTQGAIVQNKLAGIGVVRISECDS